MIAKRPGPCRTEKPGCLAAGQNPNGEGRGLARFPQVRARFQSPPVTPCMRFSRTRLTDVLHRVDSAFSPPGPEGPGRDDGSVEDDQAQVVWGEEHLFDAPSPGVAPVAFLGHP